MKLQREYDATNTMEQALAAAKKYAKADGATRLLVGDRTTIEAGIRELKLGEIVGARRRRETGVRRDGSRHVQ